MLNRPAFDDHSTSMTSYILNRLLIYTVIHLTLIDVGTPIEVSMGLSAAAPLSRNT